MAQQQVNINIAEVGFNGLDTVSSPITQDTSFAAVAENCVIDRFGRIGARKAFRPDTDNMPTPPTIAGAVELRLEIDVITGGTIAGELSVICTGRYVGYDAAGEIVDIVYYIFERNDGELNIIPYPSLTDESTLSKAAIVPTDDRFYICSEGNETLVWDGTDVTLISSQVGYVGIQNTPGGSQEAPTFAGCIASHGRIWGWGHEGDFQTLYYSDLLIGASNFTVDGIDPASTAGKINVLEQWPNGKDNIVGVATHNNKLMVFGRQSIVVFDIGYGDPADPESGFRLIDTITNIGLVSRDAIANIGTDVLFLDDTGVRSLARTIQEDSSPIGDLTNRIRFDISREVANTFDKSKLKMVYDSTENFALVLFEDFCYCLDMKSYLSQGQSKITRWNRCFFRDFTYTERDGNPLLLFAGKENRGILKYEGYLDFNAVPYRLKYVSNPLTFGQPSNEKFVKQIDYTIISRFSPQVAFARWGYDRIEANKSRNLTINAISPAYYNDNAVYGIAKYGESEATLARYKVNVGGRGETFTVGLEIDIQGNDISLQEINIQTLLGRLN